MAQIKNKKKYPLITPKDKDFLVATQESTGKTRSISVGDLSQHIIDKIPNTGGDAPIKDIKFKGESLPVVNKSVEIPSKLSEFDNDLNLELGDKNIIEKITFKNEELQIVDKSVEIPSKLSEFDNDLNLELGDKNIIEKITFKNEELQIVDKSVEIPSKLSEFDNDLDIKTQESVENIKTISDLRLREGKEEGEVIRLLGYYEAGDKPELLYKWVSGEAEDDGGSVIKVGDGYWSALFNGKIYVEDFGAKGNGVNDDTNSIQKTIDKAKGEKKVIITKKYRTTKSLNIHRLTHIEGVNYLDTLLIADHEHNVIQHLNGYTLKQDGTVDNWGTTTQAKLLWFGITSTKEYLTDEFDRQIEFNPASAIHIEGLRYQGIIEGVRIINAFSKGIYLFGSWGSRVNNVEMSRLKYGIELDSGSNSVSMDRIQLKRTGNVTNVNDGGGINIRGRGDTTNQFGNGVNITIKNSIIETGVGSPAIIADNVANLDINCYIERQTRNQRSIDLKRCRAVTLRNTNIQNSLGVLLNDCHGVVFDNYHQYGYEDYSVDKMVYFTGEQSSNVSFINSFLNFKSVKTIDKDYLFNMCFGNENDVENIVNFCTNINNLNKNPFFQNGNLGTNTSNITRELNRNGLEIVFNKSTQNEMLTFNSVVDNTTSDNTNEMFCIVHFDNYGDKNKYVQITRSEGSSLKRVIPFKVQGDNYAVIRIPNASKVIYNLRFGMDASTNEGLNNKMTIKGVYFGHFDYKGIMNI